MTSSNRRMLTIDDPLGDGACHVARSGPAGDRLQELPLGEIHPNPDQPRKRFDEAALAALAASIGERGVLQPIIVRPRDEGGYHLVAGERRWRAAGLVDLPSIPALIDATLDGGVSLELALIENMARQDLTAIEEARTIAVLLDDLGVTRADLARRLGRSRSDVAHTVRLLELPDAAIDLIDAGELSKGHGKVLLTEPDHARRRTLARRAAADGWSVRRLEHEIHQAAEPSTARPRPAPDHEAAATRLGDTLGRITGSDVRSKPHGDDGYALLIERAAADRLIAVLTEGTVSL